MSNSLRLRLLASAILVVANGSCPPALSAEHAGSKTVIGKSNPLLARGAEALESGRIAEGIQLTLEGLKVAATKQETAAGHSNACAGYVLQKQWADALVHCNAAIELDRSNWRTYNNRAGIYIAQGLFDLAMRDLEAGFALAPGAPMLRQTLQVLQINKRLVGRQAKKIVPS
jgi:tetratricopeptide (TPR) repeat protein